LLNWCVTRGARFPERRITAGASKSPNSVASIFFNTVHLLLKDLVFEHGGARLVFCPGRQPTSLCPLLNDKTLCTLGIFIWNLQVKLLGLVHNVVQFMWHAVLSRSITIGVAREQGVMAQKFLEYLVILCFERRYPKPVAYLGYGRHGTCHGRKNCLAQVNIFVYRFLNLYFSSHTTINYEATRVLRGLKFCVRSRRRLRNFARTGAHF